MTAPRPREQRRPPSPHEHPPGGRSSRHTVTAAGRPPGFARLGGARRALFRAARAAAVVACLSLAGAFALPAVQAHTTKGPHGSEHTHFYLWRTTVTVGSAAGKLGYDKSDSLGSISTSAKFGLPPWNPPHKHHVDRDSYHTVEAIYSFEQAGATLLRIDIPGSTSIRMSPGSVTLWLNHTAYPLTVGSETGDEAVIFNTFFEDTPDVTWKEDDEVRVALVYERQLPSAPENVSVTAPDGEVGTLEVSWDEADKGTFPIECYLVEFHHPRDDKKRKQSYPGSRGTGKGCDDTPPTSVKRTDLEPGVRYEVKVQALSGDGHSDWSETVTAPRTRGIPTSCALNPGDLWCGVVTVGGGTDYFGYDDQPTPVVGGLSDVDFDFGTNSYTIFAIFVGSQTAALPGSLGLSFSPSTRPTAADREKLVLHIGSAAYRLSQASVSAGRAFSWNDAGLDWSRQSYVILRLREESPAGSPGARSGR